MKKFLILPLLLIVGVTSWYFYQQALTQASYNGLPTVPCIDTTLPIKQSYTFHILITINGKNYPLDKSIGHDYGNCLHDIYVKDTSGKVYVQTNGHEKFTLKNFFDVWHTTFNEHQIFGYQTSGQDTISVLVNGQPVTTFEKTPITPNENISIIYQ